MNQCIRRCMESPHCCGAHTRRSFAVPAIRQPAAVVALAASIRACEQSSAAPASCSGYFATGAGGAGDYMAPRSYTQYHHNPDTSLALPAQRHWRHWLLRSKQSPPPPGAPCLPSYTPGVGGAGYCRVNKIAHLQGRARKTVFYLYVYPPPPPQVLEALALREEPPDVEDLEDSTLPLLDEAAPHIQKFKANCCPWAPRCCCCGGCSPSAGADPRRQLQAARHAGGWRTQLGRTRILHFAAAHPLHYSPAPTHPHPLMQPNPHPLPFPTHQPPPAGCGLRPRLQ